MCFFYLFLLFYFSFDTCIVHDYVRQKNTFDIGQRYTNLIKDIYPRTSVALEILRNNELNNDHLNNRRRRKKHAGDALEYATDWGKGSQSSSTSISAR